MCFSCSFCNNKNNSLLKIKLVLWLHVLLQLSIKDELAGIQGLFCAITQGLIIIVEHFGWSSANKLDHISQFNQVQELTLLKTTSVYIKHVCIKQYLQAECCPCLEVLLCMNKRSLESRGLRCGRAQLSCRSLNCSTHTQVVLWDFRGVENN